MSQNPLDDLIEAALDNPELFGALYAELLAAELFVLTANEGGGSESRTFEAGEEISLVHYQLEDGTPFVPVFTSLEELEASIDQDLGYYGANGWGLLNLVQSAHVVINPSSDNALLLTPDNIAEILEHFDSEEIVVDEDTEILIGQPEEDPAALKKAIADMLGQYPSVRSASLCLVVQAESMQQSFLVGVTFEPGKENRDIFKMIGAGVTKHLPPGILLDFVVMTDDKNDSLSDALKREGDMFFTAKSQA